MSGKELLQLFFIPPSEVPIKETGERLKVEVKVVCEPITDEEKGFFKEGKAILAGYLTWFWGLTLWQDYMEEYIPFPYLTNSMLLAPVDKTSKYDPNGEYWYSKPRLTEDFIGKEITFTGFGYMSWPYNGGTRWEFGEGAAVGPSDVAIRAWPGVYDMRASLILFGERYDIPTAPHSYDTRAGYRLPSFYQFGERPDVIGGSPLYGSFNSCGYKVSRDEIKSFCDARKINPEAVMTEALAKVKDTLKMPKVKYLESSFPEIVAAGEPFSATHRFYNDGEPGIAQLRLIADGTMTTTSFTANKITSSPESLNMPWDDLKRNYLVELLSPVPTPIKITKLTLEGKDYKPFDIPSLLTDSKSFASFIPAGFPVAALGSVDAPDSQKAGDVFTLDLPITNTGYRGDIGVRIIAPGFERDIMQRMDSGTTITPRYTGEMSATESFRITAIPIYLGRNRETVLGAEKVFEITPRNTLFHWDGVVKVFGGYAERNEFTGFVAGKNVRVKGLTITPGTGPLPFGYAGYMLTGTLGEGETAEIEYDELYYLRVEAVSGIAIARRGALVERDTKLYEYSVLPTPAMASHAFKSIGSLLTRTGPGLEVK